MKYLAYIEKWICECKKWQSVKTDTARQEDVGSICLVNGYFVEQFFCR